jgi:hypothetical protein
MKNVKFFNLHFGTVFLRFYLMMGIVIAAGFSGFWLIGLLALPIFLSIMLGLTFKLPGFKKQLKPKEYPNNISAPAGERSNLSIG